MNKAAALDKITREIAACGICKVGKIGKPVAGEGNPNADIVFVGEAPGKEEAKTGRPFVGRSGKLLRHLIKEIGLKEEGIYITSPVKFLPAKGIPTASDIAHGKAHFDEQIRIIDPKYIVLLGSVATQAALGEKIPIKKHHGTLIQKNGRSYFITLHPAAALRFPPLKKLLQEDFKTLGLAVRN